jgi:hypothetical protein
VFASALVVVFVFVCAFASCSLGRQRLFKLVEAVHVWILTERARLLDGACVDLRRVIEKLRWHL